MASKTLTARVNINTTQANNKIDSLVKKINKLNNAVNKQPTSGLEGITKQTDLISNKTSGIISKVASWASKQKLVTSATKSTGGALSQVIGKLKMLASTYLGVMGMKAALGTTDTMISAQNRLNYSNAKILGDDISDGYSNATFQATQAAMDKMYVSSQKVRMSYTDMMANVSKFMTLAPNAFQNNADNAIRFQEIMAEAYAIGGASAAEMSSSMYQLTQALGAGNLAGDELRSVREGAPLAYQKIEEFAQGVYNTEESLKDLASQGKITSDMVVAAVMNAGNELDTAFAQTSQTFGQTWEQIKNAAKKSFEPVAVMLRDMLNKAIENGLIQKIEKFFNVVSKVLQITFKLIEKAVIWISDNARVIKDVLLGVLTAIVSYYILMGVIALVVAAIWIATNLTIVAWAAFIILAIYGILKPLLSFISGIKSLSEAITEHLIIVAVALAVLALATGNAVLLIPAVIAFVLAVMWEGFDKMCYILGFIAAVIVDIVLIIWNFLVAFFQAIVYDVVIFALAIWDVFILLVSVILGLVFWLATLIYNIGCGLVNSLIHLLFSMIEPIIGIVEFILNVCMGGFDSFGGAVANLIGQIISWFLTLGKTVTTIIDAIFGTDWTGGLSSLQDKVLSWGKNEKGITLSRDLALEEFTGDRLDMTNAFEIGLKSLTGLVVDPNDPSTAAWKWFEGLDADMVDASKWGSAAGDWGAGVKNGLDKWGSKFQLDKNGSWLDDWGKKLGLDFTDLPSGTDPANMLDGYNFPSNEDLLGGIKDDTGNISDSMDLTNEDLEYLRKIAEMEWRNEFTTAEIKVDMTNHNTVNGERDLDGIVSYLSDVLRDEMTSVAYGDHY